MEVERVGVGAGFSDFYSANHEWLSLWDPRVVSIT